jgi:hypothetical protein
MERKLVSERIRAQNVSVVAASRLNWNEWPGHSLSYVVDSPKVVMLILLNLKGDGVPLGPVTIIVPIGIDSDRARKAIVS